MEFFLLNSRISRRYRPIALFRIRLKPSATNQRGYIFTSYRQLRIPPARGVAVVVGMQAVTVVEVAVARQVEKASLYSSPHL